MKVTKRFFTWFTIVALVMAFVPVLLAQEREKININKASVKQLTALTQIGPKKAERILEYREKNGPFEQPEDIMKVKGISSKTFEVNKDRIAVE